MPKFDLPDELQSLDGLDEKDRIFYVEKDDGKGFVFKHPHAAVSTIRNVKAEKQALAEEIRDLKEKMKKVEDIDPEEYAALKSKKKELEDAKASLPEELERVKQELRHSSDAKIAEEQAKRRTLEVKAIDREKTAVIREALSRAGATEAGVNYLSKIMKSEITVEWDDDEPAVKIYDDSGKKLRLNKDADPMKVDDLVANYKKDLPSLFGSRARSGSGSGGNNDDDLTIDSDADPSQWTPAQKVAARKRLGEEGYKALVLKANERNRNARVAAEQERQKLKARGNRR